MPAARHPSHINMLSLVVSQCLVYDLTKRIEKQVASGKPLFIKYMAPWCMQCRVMDESFDSLSDVLSGEAIRVGEVNCIEREEFCLSQGVKKFPHLILYNSGSGVAPLTYSGPYTVRAMKQWVLDHLGKSEL